MRAGLLARVSTEGQAEAGRHSLGMQLAQMEGYAEREGMEVVAVFTLPGESAFGKEMSSRPLFEAALAAAERREFDVLLVYDLSRFARRQKVLHEALYRLERAGVRLIGVHNAIDYTSDDGGDWAGIEGVFAERASKEHSRRVRHAKEKAFDDGLPVGSLPFGYGRPAQGVVPILREDEAAAVREVFRLRCAGEPDAHLAAYLNSTGLRPRSRRGYTGWTAMSARLYRSSFYAGFVEHKGERREGQHEALVSVETWEAAQPQGGVRRERSNVTARCLLQGVAFCAWCEGKLWLAPRGGRSSYYDRAALYGRECGSKRRTWPTEGPDGLVSETMRALSVDRAWLRDAAREARRVRPVEGAPERRRALLSERERATEAYVAGALSRERWQSMVSRVEEELGRLPETVDRVVMAVRQLERFGEVWEVASLERKREAVGIVFRRVMLDMEGRTVALEAREGYEALLVGRREVVGRVMGPERVGGISRPLWFTPAELGVSA